MATHAANAIETLPIKAAYQAEGNANGNGIGIGNGIGKDIRSGHGINKRKMQANANGKSANGNCLRCDCRNI